MVEFAMFLTPVSHELLKLVYSKGFSIFENSPICYQNKSYYGITMAGSNGKKFIICTRNIKSAEATRQSFEYSINETVAHEAVHVAQHCNKNNSLNTNINVSKLNLNNVYSSVSLMNSRYGGDMVTRKEKEAYYLEKNPRQVLEYVKKYCF